MHTLNWPKVVLIWSTDLECPLTASELGHYSAQCCNVTALWRVQTPNWDTAITPYLLCLMPQLHKLSLASQLFSEIFSCKNSQPVCHLILNLWIPGFLLRFHHILSESMEGIPSVHKSLLQASSQASKLLHPLTYDFKRLEVSGLKEKTPLWSPTTVKKWLKMPLRTQQFQCLTQIVMDVQDFINQLITMETVITQARSLRAKFATCKKDEDTAEVDKWVLLLTTCYY